MSIGKKITSLLLLTFCLLTQLSAQTNDTILSKLSQYVGILTHFSKQLPQEKVYVHMDNSTYYQGDDIWFACYLVTSGQHSTSTLSKTLYVELLNPGGEVIETQILKVENGRCHGSFKLGKLPFYSGFYEVRAYTKYMLNFGSDVIFSRTFPVYDKPTKPGAYAEKSLLEYGRGKYPMLRAKVQKQDKVTVHFFPEGGSLVAGVPSQVAFEATDAYGLPIDITGEVVTENKETQVRFHSEYEGRGVFSFTPSYKIQPTDKAPKVVVNYKDKKYTVDLPAVQLNGIVLKVDNLSSPDSIGITLQSNNDTPRGIFGLVLLSGSSLQKYVLIDTSEGKPIQFRICKTDFPAGVSRIVLFNTQGQIVGDRLMFIHRTEKLSIQAKTDKARYQPYEQVNMQFAVSMQDTIPIETTFSVSVRDKQNDVKPDQDIQSNLLLMSEIKGYVHNPGYYFESTDSVHRRALDQLLMVQGWHRFDWDWVSGKKTFDLKRQPEKAIDVTGQVVTFVKSVPKPKVNVSALICQKNDSDKIKTSFMENFVTDSQGRFHFTADVEGRWEMIFAVTEKGKNTDHRTVMDKLFSPEPRRYRYTDLFGGNSSIPEENKSTDIPTVKDTQQKQVKDSIALQTSISQTKINYDSIAKAGVQGKMLNLKGVMVKAKKYSKEKDILEARSKSLTHYDVYAEQDKVRDKGDIPEDYLNDFLMKKNKDFYLYNGIDSAVTKLMYKTKEVLFVVDYQNTSLEENSKIPYYVRADYIKSIFVSENNGSLMDYFILPIGWKRMDVNKKFSCAVFLEMLPGWKTPAQAGKGVRKTWLDGYSPVKEFYSPNYSTLPTEPDYRRTLYWNPAVKTDKDGKALIQFYNNSSCKSFSISAETITSRGVIGVLKE